MSILKFLIGFIVSIALSYSLFFLVGKVIPLDNYFDILNYAVIFFSLITLTIYFLGERAIKSQSKTFFIYIVLFNVLFKLFAAFLFVFIYSKQKNPEDTYFVFPFLWVYLIFLVFETYFLSIQAKSSK